MEITKFIIIFIEVAIYILLVLRSGKAIFRNFNTVYLTRLLALLNIFIIVWYSGISVIYATAIISLCVGIIFLLIILFKQYLYFISIILLSISAIAMFLGYREFTQFPAKLMYITLVLAVLGEIFYAKQRATKN